MLLSMPLFNSTESYSQTALVQDLRNHWKLTVSDIEEADGATIMRVDGERVVLLFVDAPIPSEEFEQLIPATYLWNNPAEAIQTVQAHLVASVGCESGDVLSSFKLLTKINASTLRVCDHAIGIYHGSQTLLIQKEIYIEFSNLLLEDMLPIQLWVYFGVRGQQDSDKTSLFTFGLSAFNHLDIEVIETTMANEEMYEFITNIVNYILSSNAVLEDGQTLGFSAEHKIAITQSEGVYLEGDTLKLNVEDGGIEM